MQITSAVRYYSLAQYIADYVNTELERGNEITPETIINAIDAYEGGAR